jgi:hypothetical protein
MYIAYHVLPNKTFLIVAINTKHTLENVYKDAFEKKYLLCLWLELVGKCL